MSKQPRYRFFVRASAFALVFTLAGCAGGLSTSDLFASKPTKPKTVIVSDFSASNEIAAIDRGFSTRQESKGGNFPILERRQRTLSRVNDEIVATIVAIVREAGMAAAPGTEQGLSAGDNAILVTGDLRPPDDFKPSQMAQVGFGPGRTKIVAEMTVTRAGGSKEKLLSFIAVPERKGGPTGKAAVMRNAEIADVLVAESAAPEKLSPDVEGQARRLGQAIADRIVALAKEKGWLEKPEGAEETVKLPEAKPEAKPKAEKKKVEKKPAKPAAADKPAAKPADADKPDAKDDDSKD
jgi:hypothetical protein